jgi:hypothetical protein
MQKSLPEATLAGSGVTPWIVSATKRMTNQKDLKQRFLLMRHRHPDGHDTGRCTYRAAW